MLPLPCGEVVASRLVFKALKQIITLKCVDSLFLGIGRIQTFSK